MLAALILLRRVLVISAWIPHPASTSCTAQQRIIRSMARMLVSENNSKDGEPLCLEKGGPHQTKILLR